MKNIYNIIFLIFLLFLSSCEASKTFVLIEPGKAQINNVYELETNKKWSQFQQDEFNFIFWTVDGWSLERIVFFKPISDNESLYDHQSFFSVESEKRPIFNSNMNKFEIKEFFENCMIWAKQLTNIKITKFKNYKLDNIDGITFDIFGTNELGLNYRGFVVAGVKDKKLHLAYFIAAETEFFDLYYKEAKNILASIKFL